MMSYLRKIVAKVTNCDKKHIAPLGMTFHSTFQRIVNSERSVWFFGTLY
jgi:hypothetical protein